jgi:hypothetical protein
MRATVSPVTSLREIAAPAAMRPTPTPNTVGTMIRSRSPTR